MNFSYKHIIYQRVRLYQTRTITIFGTAPRFNASVTYTTKNWFKWLLSKLIYTNEGKYLGWYLNMQITLATKEVILTKRWKKNVLVVFLLCLHKNLPKQSTPSILFNHQSASLINILQLRITSICFIKHKQLFIIRVNSN